jgi:hypothetical protein
MATKLRDLLAATPAGVTKFAVEMPDRQQIEQDFGHMAFQFLRDRAPALLPSMIGFEVVEQEPDGSRAVGIFGFNIGQSFWYVPCFFTNNQIKGMDLLYSVDKSSFVPLQEPWINHLLNRQMIELGEGANNKVMKTIENPNFDFLTGPPASPKSASQWLADVKQDWEKLGGDIARRVNSDPEFKEALAGAIASMTGKALEIEKRATPLIEFLKNVGGPAAVATVLRTFENPAFLKAACAFYDYRDLMIADFDPQAFPKQAQVKVRVVTETESPDYDRPATAEQKTKIVRDGFTIVDDRPPEDHTELYAIDYERQIFNPTEGGKYRLILRDGTQTPVNILYPTFRGSRPGMVVVVSPDNSRYMTCDASDLHLQSLQPEDEAKEAKNSLYEKGIAVNDMKLGEEYVLVDELQKNCSLPFRVNSSTKQDGNLVKICVHWHDYPTFRSPRPWKNQESEIGSCYNPGVQHQPVDWYSVNIAPVDRAGKLQLSSTGQFIVPTKSWKAVKLGDRDGRDDKSYLTPASRVDIDELMTKAGCHRLAIASDGSEFSFRLDGELDMQQLGYKSASIRLVGIYGLQPADAETLLREAAAQQCARRLIKVGQVVMQPPPPQWIGTDPLIGTQVMTPQELLIYGQTIGAPAQKQYTGPGSGFNLGGDATTQQMAGAQPETQGPGPTGGQGGLAQLGGQPGGGAPQLPPDVQALAQQAAQTGQGQVFDHGVIGGLSRTYDVSSAVDSYVPELLKAVDRLGRLLFLFYWKNTEFAERYGSKDMTDLEDEMRSVFKNLGDLVLKLRQKSIDGQEGEFISAEG